MVKLFGILTFNIGELSPVSETRNNPLSGILG